MSLRALLLGLAASTLLLAACGEEKVSVYRVPKEKDPEPPAAAAADAGTEAPAQPAPGAAMADTAVPTASGEALVWQAPADWKTKAPGQMRKASYTVAAAGATAELSVTAFPGDVGGELANVNRWRGQVGLLPLAAADLDGAVSRVDSNGLRVTVVELAARDGKGTSILGAIVPVDGSTWFFKLMGPLGAVQGAKPEFLGFLHTVRAP